MPVFNDSTLTNIRMSEVMSATAGLFDLSQLKSWEKEVKNFVQTQLKDISNDAERRAKIEEFRRARQEELSKKYFDDRVKRETELYKLSQQSDSEKLKYLTEQKEAIRENKIILDITAKNIEKKISELEERKRVEGESEEIINKLAKLEGERDNNNSKLKELLEQEDKIVKAREDLFENEEEFKKALEKAQEKAQRDQRRSKLSRGERLTEEDGRTNIFERFAASKDLNSLDFVDRLGDKLSGLGNGLSDRLGDSIGGKLGGALGKLGGVISGPLSSVLGVIKIIGDYSEKYLQETEQMFNALSPSINERLQGVGKSFEDIAEFIKESTAYDRADGIESRKVIDNVGKLIDAGIAYDVEQRAFLATVTDEIKGTFEAFGSNLNRIIRLQQQDSSYIRFGLEKSLNELLNASFKDSTYLKDVFDDVSSSLLEASSRMGAYEATEFEYATHKWLGALYSLGASDSFVKDIAEAIGKLGSGNITDFASSSAGTLLIKSMTDVGLNLGEIAQTGLGADTTNALLASMVNYLGQISNDTYSNNVVATEIGKQYGFRISDLRSVENLTSSSTYQNLLDMDRVTYYDMADATYAAMDRLNENLTITRRAEIVEQNRGFNNALNLTLSKFGQGVRAVSNFLDKVPIFGGGLKSLLSGVATVGSEIFNAGERVVSGVSGQNDLYNWKNWMIDAEDYDNSKLVQLGRDGSQPVLSRLFRKFTIPGVILDAVTSEDIDPNKRYLYDNTGGYSSNRIRSTLSESTSVNIMQKLKEENETRLQETADSVSSSTETISTNVNQSLEQNRQGTVTDITTAITEIADEQYKREHTDVYDIYKGLFDEAESKRVWVENNDIKELNALFKNVVQGGTSAVRTIISGIDNPELEFPTKLSPNGEIGLSNILYTDVTNEIQGGQGYNLATLIELIISFISRNGSLNVNLSSSDINLREIVVGEGASNIKEAYTIDRPKGSGVGASPSGQSSLFHKATNAVF